MRLLPRRRRSADTAPPRPKAALKITPGAFDSVEAGQPLVPFIATPPGQGAAARAAFTRTQAATYSFIYRTQPAVRKVIDYIARNAAQIGVKLYERESDNDRTEDRDHPAARTMRRPGSRMTGRRFIYGLVGDFLIYDNFYALKFRPPGSAELVLFRVPVWSMEVLEGTSSYTPTGYRLHLRGGEIREFAPEDVLHIAGYDPDDPASGISRLETLREQLTEEAVNQAANVERLKHGGLGPGYIKRPLEAPDWSDPARDRFESDWAERAKGRKDGKRKDPVLEEGMEFVESSITPKDAEMLSSRIFTRAEVASLYGLPAELIEAAARPRDREEARTQFYTDCLPPVLSPIAEELDLQILEEEYGTEDHYFEFNLEEKLKGQEAERFKVLVSAAGGPILTRNEARDAINKPDLPGGDELITPLNVVVGGKPSPGVMGPQDAIGPDQDGGENEPEARRALERPQAELIARRRAQGERRDRYAQEHTDLLRSTFARQERSYRASKTFDLTRWDAELSDDLEEQALATVEREGGIAAERLAIAGGFDLDRTRRYLRRGAEERAHAINSTTAQAIEEAEAEDGAGGGEQTLSVSSSASRAVAKQDPFEKAKGERAEEGGAAIATSLAAFSHAEAGRQAPDATQRQKTWIVTSSNSRHPHLQGETVPVFETFSNGGQYPGDPKLGTEETARCACLLEVI